jgi:flagellar assembly factor FliW
MKCDTFLFGTIDVSPDSVIEFPQGLPGFPDNKRFALIHEGCSGDAPASFTLQSLDDRSVALQIADPCTFGLHYELDLTDEEAALLQATRPEEIALMLVLFKQEEAGSPIRANLQAPLLINTRSRRGLQKVMPKVEPRVTLRSLSVPA